MMITDHHWTAMKRTAAALWVFLAALLTTGLLHADPASCIQNHEYGQKLERQSSLIAAREMYAQCANSSCPLAIAQDCGKLLEAINSGIPSVIIGAKDPLGTDTDGVQVLLDSQPYTLNGAAIELDPGGHSVEFRWHSGETTFDRFLLNEGEKRRVILGLEPSTETSSETIPSQNTAPPIAATDGGVEPEASDPLLAYVLAGVSVAALGGFVAFALQRNNRQNCKPTCTQAEADAMRTSYLLADVSLGVSILALGGAGYVYLSRPSTPPPTDISTPRSLGLTAGLKCHF